jgi:hypothetical protein
MSLPADLLHAIAAEEGGKVALVIGAGCSAEAPTSLPLSRPLSEESHRRLVANGVLEEGECDDPSDLSKLADVVYAKTGSQAALVNEFPLARFRNAEPNEGYRLAAALLREQAVSDVLTLNFDLAARHALVGAGAEVGIVAGPDELAAMAVVNLIHLHRDMHADADDWILRTEQIQVAWSDGWEQVIATRVITAPVIVFVGLGTPAAVLVETTQRVQRALVRTATYHVDPLPFGESSFTAALGIPVDRYVRLGWSDFMRELGQRVVLEQIAVLRNVAERIERERGLAAEDLDVILRQCSEIGLLRLGEARARWVLRRDTYLPARGNDPALIANLVQAMSLLARHLGVVFVLGGDGCLQMRRDDRVVGILVPASGDGTVGWIEFEAELLARPWVAAHQRHDRVVVLAGGVVGSRETVAAPVDLIAEGDPDSIRDAPRGPMVVDVDALRAEPEAALAGLR